MFNEALEVFLDDLSENDTLEDVLRSYGWAPQKSENKPFFDLDTLPIEKSYKENLIATEKEKVLIYK